ncbi:lipoprotein [Spirochaetia bacterium]|nr:lipoprotein [Spirochaetia bacterium]
MKTKLFLLPPKFLLIAICASVFLSSLFFSCAGLPAARPEAPAIAENPPERPEIPPTPDHILGQGLIPRDKLALFLEKTNIEAEKDFVENLCAYYIEESAAEGVNHDIAFAQMCLETGFLRYGGLVTPDMNNFCGLGAIGPGQNGERFSEPRLGVRAHIQHLKAYATDEPLKQDLVDPRYRWVRYGSAPTINGLAGTWASDRAYAEKIAAILERLYQFTYGETGTQVAQANSALLKKAKE